MELLFGQIKKALSGPAIYRYENNIAETNKRIEQCPKINISESAAEPVIEAAKKYSLLFLEIRYHRSLDIQQFSAAEAKLNEYEKQYPEYVSALKGVIHVVRREGPDSPYRWPTHYLDVYPALQDTWREFIIQVRARDVFITDGAPEELAQPPTIRMENLKLGDFDTDYNNLCGDSPNPAYAAAMRCQCAAAKFVKESAEVLLSELDGDGDELCLIFSPHRKIMPVVKKLPNHIYTFDLLYRFCGWATTEKYIKSHPLVVGNNLKISMRLIYDILLEVISRARSPLFVHFNDSTVTPISYLFVKLGTSICQKNVKMIFNGKTPDRSPYRPPQLRRPAWEISRHDSFGGRISLQDIISIQAFYFTYYHEIFRANRAAGKAPPQVMAETPDAIINELDIKTYPLFHKLIALRKEVANKIAQIVGELPQCNQSDIDSAVEKYYAEAIKNCTPVDNPKLTILAAPPGTGKSFYIKKYARNIALVVSDDIGENYPIGGMTRDDIIKKYREGVIYNIINKSNVPEEIKPALRTTFYSDHRRTLTDNHKKLGISCKEPIINKLLANKYNSLLEESELAIGGYNADDFAKEMDDCGNIKDVETRKSFYAKLFTQESYEIVMIYIHPIKEYNQQLSRYFSAKRLMRFYEIYKYNLGIWKKIPQEHRKNLQIFSFGDNGEEYILYNKGEILMKGLHNFANNYMFDNLFVEFLSKLSNQDLSYLAASNGSSHLKW